MPTIEIRKEHDNEVMEVISKMKEDVHSEIIKTIKSILEPQSEDIIKAPGLMDMLRYYPDSMGKYSRASIMTLSAMAAGAKYEDCILPAASIQLFEDFALVHDDIEDGSLLRRGKKTIHTEYGVSRSINAGDMLHSAVEGLLYRVSKQKNGDEIYKKFREIGNTTSIGQDKDIYYSGRNALKATEDICISIAADKTSAYSVYGPLQIGALIGGSGLVELQVLKQIGLPAGIAFQINDDIKDVEGKVAGKDKYEDIKQGKATLILINTYKNSGSAERARMESIYSKKPSEKDDGDISYILELIKETDSVEYARKIRKEYEKSAINALVKGMNIIPKNQYSEALMELIGTLYAE
ncbi:MAG: polyprenyl synthetase family protein [Methanothrix sp.]